MPIIDISKKDLENLLGKKLAIKELEELVLVVKGEIESADGDTIKIEIKDINRPDLWCTTGIARELRGQIGKERGLPNLKAEANPKYKVIVDSNLKDIRPLTVCAVLKGVKLSGEAIKQLIELQEKLSENYGRGRKEAALGVYDADKIAWPVTYRAADPDKQKFIPLEMEKELPLRKILSQHEKGRKYRHLLEGKKKYPLFIDAKKQVLSMPPIINSNYSGKITEDTKNAFIEVSGHSFRFIIPCLLVMVSEFADRGAKIEAVQIHYKNKKISTPNFKPYKIEVETEKCNELLGLSLSGNEIKKLLEKRRHNVKIKHNKLIIESPAYRNDIMHERDIIEDIAISYGYNKIEPEIAKLATFGEQSKESETEEKIANLLTGLSMQEVATFTLTDKKGHYKEMNLKEESVVEIENPVSILHTILRNKITPSLLTFLAKNKKARYPQRIFELGTCVEQSKKEVRDIRKLAVAITHRKANYTEAKQVLEYLLKHLNKKFQIQEIEHPTFIEGRVAKATIDGKQIAILGEIHPSVLRNFNLDMPVAVFELNLGELLS